MEKNESKALAVGLKEGDFEAYRLLYDRYYRWFCSIAHNFVADPDTAEDIVQQSILKLWKTRSRIDVDKEIIAYLKTIIRNEAINYLKHKKIETQHQQNSSSGQKFTVYSEYDMLEMENHINEHLKLLPDKTREIFLLSRVDELKYVEIAERLNISVKTVEYHISKALSSFTKLFQKLNHKNLG